MQENGGDHAPEFPIEATGGDIAGGEILKQQWQVHAHFHDQEAQQAANNQQRRHRHLEQAPQNGGTGGWHARRTARGFGDAHFTAAQFFKGIQHQLFVFGHGDPEHLFIGLFVDAVGDVLLPKIAAEQTEVVVDGDVKNPDCL